MTTKNLNQKQPPPESPKKKDPEKVAGRKIPQTLVGSYDLITLKQQKRKRFQFKKQQSKQEPLMNKQLQKLSPLQGECSCSEDLKQQFSQTVYQLNSTHLVLSKICSLRIRSLQKIKLIGQAEGQNSVLMAKYLKLTWNTAKNTNQPDDEIYVKLKTKEEAYLLFSSIITRKLLHEDFALVDLNLNKSDVTSFNDTIKKIQGEIWKVSTFMRKWQKKMAHLENQLVILKDGKPCQELKQFKQIWTRFAMYNGYFVIKMWEGMQKIQMGIPLSDFSNLKSERNWLFLLSKMIK